MNAAMWGEDAARVAAYWPEDSSAGGRQKGQGIESGSEMVYRSLGGMWRDIIHEGTSEAQGGDGDRIPGNH
jgi:hypothetical protein